jgi:peptidoglycan/xylan/chitin deacetylase (PgdA/CDA1 family)
MPPNFSVKKTITILIIITFLLAIAKLLTAFLALPMAELNYLPIIKKQWIKQEGVIKIPVLTYHHIRKAKTGDYNSVSPEIFDQQMNWLKENNYQVISYGQFYQILTSTAKEPQKSVVITFDDGYKDQYQNGLPILKKYGYPAIFFVNYNSINWWGYMSWDMLKDLIKNKMEIGSHSLNHKNLTKLSLKNIIYELRQGKLKLEYRLTSPIYHLAYPNGFYSSQIIEQAANAGFWSALTDHGGATHNRADSPYAISRLHVNNNLESFIKLLQE